jgi:hypothetical protein
MTASKTKTIGDTIAAELIAAKANGEHFDQPKLAAFIDIRVEQWLQRDRQPAVPCALEADLRQAEVIYEAYPRKIGKTQAIKKLKAIIKAGDNPYFEAAMILEATKQYAAAVELWPARDRAYIPHPATWFNRGSYLDDPKEWIKGTPPTITKGLMR